VRIVASGAQPCLARWPRPLGRRLAPGGGVWPWPPRRLRHKKRRMPAPSQEVWAAARKSEPNDQAPQGLCHITAELQIDGNIVKLLLDMAVTRQLPDSDSCTVARQIISARTALSPVAP